MDTEVIPNGIDFLAMVVAHEIVKESPYVTGLNTLAGQLRTMVELVAREYPCYPNDVQVLETPDGIHRTGRALRPQAVEIGQSKPYAVS